MRGRFLRALRWFRTEPWDFLAYWRSVAACVLLGRHGIACVGFTSRRHPTGRVQKEKRRAHR